LPSSSTGIPACVTAEVNGGENAAKATWKKSVLVIEEIGRLKMPGSSANGVESFHFTDRWTLATDGHTLKHDSEGFETHQVYVYDKQ
jgi:hypothetical protein